MKEIIGFYDYFNLLLGLAMLLIGLEVIKPFDAKRQESIIKRFKVFFILGGLLAIIFGVVRILI